MFQKESLRKIRILDQTSNSLSSLCSLPSPVQRRPCARPPATRCPPGQATSPALGSPNPAPSNPFDLATRHCPLARTSRMNADAPRRRRAEPADRPPPPSLVPNITLS